MKKTMEILNSIVGHGREKGVDWCIDSAHSAIRELEYKNPHVFENEDGSYTLKIGPAYFEIPKRFIDKCSAISEGGPCSLVFVDDMIDEKQVEVMNVGGQNYSKSDLRMILEDIGYRKKENTLQK